MLGLTRNWKPRYTFYNKEHNDVRKTIRRKIVDYKTVNTDAHALTAEMKIRNQDPIGM